MVAPDPASTALAKAGGEAAIEAAESFLSRLLGPAAAEAGLLLQDKVRVYRLSNQLRLLKRSKEMLDRAGVNPQTVPLRVLLPLLEGAALEEDTDLSDKWAALLATAADPSRSTRMVPSFITILSQLSPDEAKILEGMPTEEPKDGVFAGYSWEEGELDSLGITPERYHLIADNLCRLGLCMGMSSLDFQGEKKVYASHLGREGLALTYLGRSFIRACSVSA